MSTTSSALRTRSRRGAGGEVVGHGAGLSREAPGRLPQVTWARGRARGAATTEPGAGISVQHRRVADGMGAGVTLSSGDTFMHRLAVAAGSVLPLALLAAPAAG